MTSANYYAIGTFTKQNVRSTAMLNVRILQRLASLQVCLNYQFFDKMHSVIIKPISKFHTYLYDIFWFLIYHFRASDTVDINKNWFSFLDHIDNRNDSKRYNYGRGLSKCLFLSLIFISITIIQLFLIFISRMLQVRLSIGR